MYALITKHRRPTIIILANTIAELDRSIEMFYYKKRAIQPRGSNLKKEDLLRNYLKAEITIREIIE